MRRLCKHWPPFTQLQPLEYCYYTWGKYLARSKDNIKWEIWEKGLGWNSGEANAVSYWLHGSNTNHEFKQWQLRIYGIKRKELNRWVEKQGRPKTYSTSTCISSHIKRSA